MSEKKQHFKSLHVKVSLAVATAAIILMFVFSFIFYKDIYQHSLKDSEHSVQQLLETVSTTAGIAAYVGNKELAHEVVSGLTKNDIVIGAKITANDVILGAQGATDPLSDSKKISIDLSAPFDKNEIVGTLSVNPNFPSIAQRARDSALATTISLAAQAGLVAIIVLLMVYWMMTRPLSFLSSALHEIIPGDGKRLKLLGRHKSDEIGLLANDINALLGTVDAMLQEERQLRHRVEVLQHQFRGIFEDSSAGIFLIHEDGSLANANPAFFQLTQKFPNAAAIPPDTNMIKETFAEADQARALIKLAIVSQRPCSGDLELSLASGEKNCWAHCIFSLAGGAQENPVVEGVMYDITKRKIAEEQTRELAEKDALTGLANRQAAETALKDLVQNMPLTQSSFVVMMIDLDRFKYINDTYGHDAGDWVLKVVANRLRNNVRTTDMVARLGGDEFLIILNKTDNLSNVKNIAEKLLQEQQNPIEVQPGFFESLSMSIGIALYSKTDDNELSVRKHADQAMYAVKRNGKNGFATYSDIGKHDIVMLEKLQPIKNNLLK